ncbi:MAG: methionyl-tRNA formyltransferase [Phycicoccus sp.]|nr:methionyl-tRNA formyltransferase [Phycicoccus sp.]
MRLLFAGTPDTAVPALEALLASDHEVVAVLTRPDARAGRGRALAPSPVKDVALAHRISVLTPTSTRDDTLRSTLVDLDLEAAAIVAYGGLIPPALLSAPTHGWINLHFSVLPAWRGAAPVQRAIMAGDTVTGASTFVLEEGLDTGPVLGTMTEAIRADDTAGTLLDRLARAGAGLLVATLDGLAEGVLHATPQPLDGVSLAPKLTVAQAEVPWHRPGYAVDRHIRGCTPAPGAWTLFRGQRLGIGPVRLLGTDEASLTPGLLLADKRSVIVGTGSGPVALDVVTPPGKRAMAAADWARGVRIDIGERFGQ